MNQNYAVIKDGVVTNVIVFDPNPEPKPEWIQSDTARIGDLWDGKQFITPDPLPLPQKEPDKIDLLMEALIKKGVIAPEEITAVSATKEVQ